MKFEQALKDKKLRENIITNIVLFICFEFFLYLIYFDWARNSINIRLDCIVSAGVITMIAAVLFILGFGNKNKRFMIYGIEFFALAVFTFLGYFILTTIPAFIRFKGISIYSFIPFIAFLIYYVIKVIIMIKNKMKN